MKYKFNRKKIEDAILKKAKKAKESARFLNASAEVWRRRVKADTRLGKSYTGAKFPTLSTAWIKRKAKLANVNTVHELYRKSKSNATFMGDTVDGIKAKRQGNKLVLFVSGKHRLIKGLRGKPLKGSDASLSDIIKGLKKLGIDIMGISKPTKEQIKKLFIREFRRTKL